MTTTTTAPLPPTAQQLGFLKGLKERRRRSLEHPASEREVVELAILLTMMPEPDSKGWASWQIDALKTEGGLITYAGAARRRPEYTALLRRLVEAGMTEAPFPTAQQVEDLLT